MLLKKNIKEFFKKSIFLAFLSPGLVYSQAVTQLSQDFLEGLPPSVRDQIEVQNNVQEEKDLEDLFRSDTSVEKNKVILDKLRKRLEAVSKTMSSDGDADKRSLDRFGQEALQVFLYLNILGLQILAESRKAFGMLIILMLFSFFFLFLICISKLIIIPKFCNIG